MPVDPASVPNFDDLPKVEGMPQGCAWGVFGKNDKVGTLNFLSPEVVRGASAEIKDGVSISLNWSLTGSKRSFRRLPDHQIISLSESAHGHYWDDEISFNTQISSQWDSLTHVQSPLTGAYNGFRLTEHVFAQTTSTATNEAPTLDHWHEAGGMVARGVLIDYKAYADEKGIPFHPLDPVRITPRDIEACASHFHLEFKPGDVLIVRTGLTELYDSPSDGDMARTEKRTLAGLDGCEATARWIWNKRFAAVASDAAALEAVPALDKDGNPGPRELLPLHMYLLNLFGMSIGELWDLKRLSRHCNKTGRYTFMLTSAPLNIPCLIGSPPNALAIF